MICTGRIRRPGPARYTSGPARPGPARDLLFISRPGPRAARPVQISGLHPLSHRSPIYRSLAANFLPCSAPLKFCHCSKKGLDHMSSGSYRPISILNTISKVIERLVLGRLKQHIQESGSFDVLQSAYRTGHSTETALVSVLDSLFTTIDNKKITVSIGLDISAAFDTISLEILLQRLRRRFGVSGTELDWIESYLSDRHQYVKLGRHRSSTIKCTSGVPQGSVLGPILFTLYTAPVADVITSCGVSYHQYADDTQFNTSLTVVEECSRAVKRWFLENDLLLNAEKSEVMFVCTVCTMDQLQGTGHI